MTLMIDLKPELEAQLREEAAKTGIDASAFVVRALEEQLKRNNRQSLSSHLSHEEAILLQKINQGLPELIWQEYQNLIAKRRAETLTSDEHVRLIVLSDDIETVHVERMAHLAELARLRQTSLKTLMAQLGIKPREI